MAEKDLERTAMEAVLATRRELGSAYDAALVESFADRIEAAVEQRARAQVQQHGAAQRGDEGSRIRQFVLGIISLGVGVPVTIVPMTATDNGLPAVVVAWLGITGVNVAHALSARRR